MVYGRNLEAFARLTAEQYDVTQRGGAEGSHANTFDKLRENQKKYDLPIPFGHDVPEPGRSAPSFMEDYHSGGRPWFTVIDAQGHVGFADFHLDVEQLLATLVTADGDVAGVA